MSSSSIFPASPILLIILYYLLLTTEPTCSVRIPAGRTQTGVRVTLTRVHSGKSSPKKQYNLNALSNARNGPNRAPGSHITSPMKAVSDIYGMRLAIGTPPVEFTAIMDTGSDLIWTKCKQTQKYFDSSKSSSFSKVNNSCESFQLDSCKQSYEDGTSVGVVLGQETLTFGAEKIPNVIFGCGTPNKKGYLDGIVGMGRGKLSLVSQLEERVFAYCLGSRLRESEASVLLTGSKASSAFAKSNIQTTPLITRGNTSYYYISLEGISLGETKLPVKKSDFAISNGDGGMVIDSGTTFMYLEKRIVDIISNAFMNQTKLKKSEGSHSPYNNALKYCFKSPTSLDKIPNLVFHFEGANWEMQKENYIYKMKGDASCLAIIANPDYEKVSVFGNMPQQNMMVRYDLDNERLSFKPANCNEI